MTTTYTRHRGQTITISLTDTGATSPAAPLVTAYARPMAANGRIVDPAAIPIRLLPQYRAADSNFGAGWTISLDAGTCAALSSIRYGLDLRITDGQGAVIITELAILSIVEPASTLPTIVPATVTYPDPTGLIVPFSGIRTIAWIPDAPLTLANPAAIVGPPGAAGTGGGGLPLSVAATATGPQSVPVTSITRALLAINGVIQRPQDFSITAGNAVLPADLLVTTGDVLTFIPY